MDSYGGRCDNHIVLDAQGAAGVTTFPCSIHGTLVEETQGTLWYAQTQEATQRLLSQIALPTGAIFFVFLVKLSPEIFAYLIKSLYLCGSK